MAVAHAAAEAIAQFDRLNDLNFQCQEQPRLAPLLKVSIPRLLSGSVSFLAYQNFYGDSHDQLSKVVNDVGFHDDKQYRKVVGAVQVVGAGKTKAGLMLTHSSIVVPWRTLPAEEGTALRLAVSYQQEHYRALIGQPASQIQASNVAEFSTRCLRALHLALLSRVALWQECMRWDAFMNTPHNRFVFALVLLNSHPPFETWMCDWWTANRSRIDQHDFEAWAEHVAAGQRFVVLVDEIHELFDVNVGFCLHRFMKGMTGPTIVDAWRQETQRRIPLDGRPTCTDMFYQLRVIMLAYLQAQRPTLAFLFCSTRFRTWKHLEEDASPLGRGAIYQFVETPCFETETVAQAIQDMFRMPPVLFQDPQVCSLLRYFGRPLNLASLLELLAARIPQDDANTDLQSWLLSCMQVAKTLSVNSASDRLRSLVRSNIATDVYTSRAVIYLLITVRRLCHGTIALAPDQDTLERIISQGIARLVNRGAWLQIADAVVEEALQSFEINSTCMQVPSRQFDPILRTLTMNQLLIPHNFGAKRYLTERALAWSALCGQLSPLTHSRLGPTGNVAGTLQELNGSPYPVVSEAELMLQIAGGEQLRTILLPSMRAGPGLWFRATDGQKNVAVVAIQSKVENVVYSWEMFLTALDSLNPHRMFHSASEQERVHWMSHYRARLHPLRFVRILFAALGFSEEVQYLVNEYNQRSGAAAPIYLLSLREMAGSWREFAADVRRHLSTTEAPDASPSFLLQDAWARLSATAKAKLTVAQLDMHLRYRGIPLSVDNSRKLKEDKIRDLNSYGPPLAQRLTLLSLAPFF